MYAVSVAAIANLQWLFCSLLFCSIQINYAFLIVAPVYLRAL